MSKTLHTTYLTEEVVLGRLTPLKTAIVNNDYEMAKFLIDNGADVNLQINCDDFINRLNNSKIDLYENKYSLKMASEDNYNVKQLRFIRESTPLEFATKLNQEEYKRVLSYNEYLVYFKGMSGVVKNQILVDRNNISAQVKNREKIVDLIFDELEDKKNVNYNDLISFTFITGNVDKFKKYIKYVVDNNGKIDFELLFKSYLEFNMQDIKESIIPFMDLVSKYDKDGNYYIELLDYYLNSKKYSMDINDFSKELLNRIPNEKRKDICLIPYCKDILSLEYLLSLGFDINQVDIEGRDILYHLLCDRFGNSDLKENEIELFNYLLENLDLLLKDKDGKNVLYYAMQRFSTNNEYIYANKYSAGTLSNLEKAVACLISKLPKEEVCNDDIKKVLEERLNYHSNYGDRISLECVYQHHKELFSVLIKKGFILSDVILNKMFESLYTQEETSREILSKKIDLDSTLDFLYKELDRNTEIQKLDIKEKYNNLMLYIDNQDLTYDEFLKNLIIFNNQIDSLKLFYKNNIKKKFDPERYLQYAKEKYNTTYENLDDYLLLLIIKGIRKFGSDKLEDILNLIPDYDINNYVFDADIGFTLSDYAESICNIVGISDDGEPIYSNEHFEAKVNFVFLEENILFTGGLMQYAILTDDLSMVQTLQKRGVNLRFLIDDVDCTWDYVNSHTMLNYIESFVHKRKYPDLDEEEENYYLSLINSDKENNSKKPKQLSLK